MALSYMDAIGIGFPAVGCHIVGDPNVYENIVWDKGEPIPSKAALDAWLAANPTASGLTITKYEFRKLFTFEERVAIDNAPTNTNLPANVRAVLTTMNIDLTVSGTVEMYNSDVISGVNFLETVGLIAPGRAVQVLANQPPA